MIHNILESKVEGKEEQQRLVGDQRCECGKKNVLWDKIIPGATSHTGKLNLRKMPCNTVTAMNCGKEKLQNLTRQSEERNRIILLPVHSNTQVKKNLFLFKFQTIH